MKYYKEGVKSGKGECYDGMMKVYIDEDEWEQARQCFHKIVELCDEDQIVSSCDYYVFMNIFHGREIDETERCLMIPYAGELLGYAIELWETENDFETSETEHQVIDYIYNELMPDYEEKYETNSSHNSDEDSSDTENEEEDDDEEEEEENEDVDVDEDGEKSSLEKLLTDEERCEMEEEIAANYFFGLDDYPQDYVKALKHFKQAIKYGSTKAYWMVGGIYYYGGNGVQQNNEKVLKYCKEGVKCGNISCYDFMMRVCVLEQEWEQARQCFHKIVELGDKTQIVRSCDFYVFVHVFLGWNIDEAERCLMIPYAVEILDCAKDEYQRLEAEQKLEKLNIERQVIDYIRNELMPDYENEYATDSLQDSDDGLFDTEDKEDSSQQVDVLTIQIHNNSLDEDVNKENEENPSLDELLQELHSLVGLKQVKDDLQSLINFIKIKQMREQRGMQQSPMSLHLVFDGNPGTGKTTVARLLAKIYKALGILSKGQLIETDRAGLVSQYIGETAIKVQNKMQEALGGVLFIDEAYTLSYGQDRRDFGQEAIDTLVKLMEDHRDDLIVIVAGYTDLMESFLSFNPGLRSRFNKHIHFQDYMPDEMMQIFLSMCEKTGLVVTTDASQQLSTFFQRLCSSKQSDFANGRTVRNIYEKLLTIQANRLSTMNCDISDEELVSINLDDVKHLLEVWE